MKKITQIILIASIAILTQSTLAQVGIGTTTPNASAELDIFSANRGLLLPRVSLTNTTLSTPLAAHVAGMTVYNIAPAVNDVSPGLYYNDGTKWVAVNQAQGNDWTIFGNAGTAIGTNFLGTTDNVDFAIRTNNSERIRVKNDGKVGIAETNPSDATLEVKGNLIIGDNYTGGNAVAQQGGATIEGRTIIGEDDFFYTALDKFVVYGNTNWIPTAVTNGDNGSGLRYAINAYTSDGTGVYAEDIDGGRGIEASVAGTTANRPVGVQGYDVSGTGRGVLGISANDATTPTDGFIGVQGVESTTSNFAIVASGDFGHTGAIVNLSDKRLKKNIKSMNNALEIINKIEPKYYDMKWEDKRYKKMGLSRTQQMGFIAQDLEQILPNLVVDKKMPLNDNLYSKKELLENSKLADKESSVMDVKMVNYVQMVPLLTQAIKEQQALIEKLEARIEKLEK
jgi:hypothetical protein